MAIFRTVKVIRLNDQVSRIDISGLGLPISNISAVTDVVLDSACEGQILVKRCGTWVNENQSSGAVATNLSSIGDVDVSSKNEGELLYYSSGSWRDTSQITIGDSLVTIHGALDVSALSVGGTVNIDLSSINDVGALTLSAGDMLIWDGASWSATSIVHPSSTIDNISSIGDVTISTPSAGDILTWHATAGDWQITAAPVAETATVTNISSIGDVNPHDTLSAGDILIWDHRKLRIGYLRYSRPTRS